jgi:hypothetical protein
MAFHVGQEVVCVDDSPNKFGDPSPIVKGASYVVSDVGESWDGPDGERR